jgi:hypothetical protein
MKLQTLGDGLVGYFNEGLNGDQIPVAVLPPGQFPPGVRVAEVRMRSGKIETFGGDLLKQALANGGRIVKILQEGK